MPSEGMAGRTHKTPGLKKTQVGRHKLLKKNESWLHVANFALVPQPQVQLNQACLLPLLTFVPLRLKHYRSQPFEALVLERKAARCYALKYPGIRHRGGAI